MSHGGFQFFKCLHNECKGCAFFIAASENGSLCACGHAMNFHEPKPVAPATVRKRKQPSAQNAFAGSAAAAKPTSDGQSSFSFAGVSRFTV